MTLRIITTCDTLSAIIVGSKKNIQGELLDFVPEYNWSKLLLNQG